MQQPAFPSLDGMTSTAKQFVEDYNSAMNHKKWIRYAAITAVGILIVMFMIEEFAYTGAYPGSFGLTIYFLALFVWCVMAFGFTIEHNKTFLHAAFNVSWVVVALLIPPIINAFRNWSVCSNPTTSISMTTGSCSTTLQLVMFILQIGGLVSAVVGSLVLYSGKLRYLTHIEALKSYHEHQHQK